MIVNEEAKNRTTDWGGFRLIMPAVAVGNVGQLAVDLLLSTLDVEHVGYLHHPSVLPMVGPDPFDLNSKRLLTSWEVYECLKEKLVIVQQRSPIAKGKAESYKEFLLNWILANNFSSVILLSSSFSQYFTAEELEGVAMHYLCTGSVMSLEEPFRDMRWKEFVIGNKTGLPDKFTIPGGGVTELLFQACQEKHIPLVVMIMVCSEGDNYPEGIKMADSLNNWLKFSKTAWKIPVSWSVPFGNKPPLTMY